MARRRAVRCAPGLVAAMAAAALLAGCAGSGFEYVSNREEGLYFKVPDSWSTLRLDEGEDDGTWVRIVDRAEDPTADHWDERLPSAPVGIVQVVPIGSQRDSVSLELLRSLPFGADPLQMAAQDQGVRVLHQDDIVTDAGFRGQRTAVALELPDGESVTVDQVAMVDAATTTLYRLMIKCETSCYEDHRGEIDQIVDSWTLEER